ncbi:motility protein A [Acidaminobacter sp.]|uniref:motility protein A n=1 Tax=Acidaminobacter sp. TaxID=1872102 RepID=UPI00137D5AC9|nr:motility protein A [Acidaminobacter sp.]MDK9710577.1 motility protein A [Acidaminobacter sp.]MZQ96812.1 motility protein A [Acidaminobacter sp.]
MKKNNIPLIAMFAGVTLIIVSIALAGNLKSFWSLSSVIITLFGSFCALTISYPLDDLKNIPVALKKITENTEENLLHLVELFTAMSRKSRKDGLLALEDQLDDIDDDFIVRCIRMVIDGMDPEVIRDVMEIEIETTKNRHKVSQDIFQTWGELAPAFGMLGTLIGLIVMLSQLQDASSIGSGMAVALITTFYGSFFANLVLVPIATNLRIKTKSEIYRREMIVVGILEIQAGTNPRVVEEIIMTYLNPKERKAYLELKRNEAA